MADARAAHDRAPTSQYTQLQRAQAAADRRLPVVLPDGDADDPRSAPPGWGSTSRSGSRGPVQTLAAAAREIGAGHFDHRAGARDGRRVRLARGRVQHDGGRAVGQPAAARAVHASTCSASTPEVEDRRRYTEAVLERVATGVVTRGRRRAASATLNPAARAAARARRRGAPARPAGDGVRGRRPRSRSRPWPSARRRRRRRAAGPGDRARARRARGAPGRRRHARCTAETAQPEGRVLVLDDITPLIRAQKVAAWREVARRLAHEIKNPLTPIQLCAQRLQRQFAGAPEPVRALVDECTGDDRRRGRVARRRWSTSSRSSPACRRPRRVPDGPARAARRARWRSTTGCSSDVRIETLFAVVAAAGAPRPGPDPARVVINLVDNADRGARASSGAIVRRDPARRRRPASCASWSPTTARASRRRSATSSSCRTTRPRSAAAGLGLAIVRRIVAEHGGTIERRRQRSPRARASPSSCRLATATPAAGR
ncbi:MAG: hypothetical protein MZW92_53855 [Comamonadaceae bacterium]|nr:hypothetical protein [Comamonadaceae bacterium]